MPTYITTTRSGNQMRSWEMHSRAVVGQRGVEAESGGRADESVGVEQPCEGHQRISVAEKFDHNRCCCC